MPTPKEVMSDTSEDPKERHRSSNRQHRPREDPRLNRRTVMISLVGFAIALALALPVGTAPACRQRLPRLLASGAKLRHGSAALPRFGAGARQLKYPPFAAMAFTPLALFSLPVAGVLVSLLNLGLWVLSAYLTRDIISRTFPDRVQSRYPARAGPGAERLSSFSTTSTTSR